MNDTFTIVFIIWWRHCKFLSWFLRKCFVLFVLYFMHFNYFTKTSFLISLICVCMLKNLLLYCFFVCFRRHFPLWSFSYDFDFIFKVTYAKKVLHFSVWIIALRRGGGSRFEGNLRAYQQLVRHGIKQIEKLFLVIFCHL